MVALTDPGANQGETFPSPRSGQLPLNALAAGADSQALIAKLAEDFSISTAEELYNFDLDHPGQLANDLGADNATLIALLSRAKERVGPAQDAMRAEQVELSMHTGAVIDDGFSLPAHLRDSL